MSNDHKKYFGFLADETSESGEYKMAIYRACVYHKIAQFSTCAQFKNTVSASKTIMLLVSLKENVSYLRILDMKFEKKFLV